MFHHNKSIPKGLLAVLPPALVAFVFLLPAKAWAQLPKGVKATYNSPATSPLIKIVNTVLGFCTIGLIVGIVVFLTQWGLNIGNRMDVGSSHPLARVGQCLVAIAFILSINTFVTGWTNYIT